MYLNRFEFFDLREKKKKSEKSKERWRKFKTITFIPILRILSPIGPSESKEKTTNRIELDLFCILRRRSSANSAPPFLRPLDIKIIVFEKTVLVIDFFFLPKAITKVSAAFIPISNL